MRFNISRALRDSGYIVELSLKWLERKDLCHDVIVHSNVMDTLE